MSLITSPSRLAQRGTNTVGSNSRGARRKRKARVGSKRRGKKTRDLKSTVLILVQGEITEKEYFDTLVRQRGWSSGVAVTVKVQSEAPDQMARRAVKWRRDYDWVFVVTDVDEWTPQQFSKAQSLSERSNAGNQIKLVITNPKFDLWLCAHYRTMKAGCDDARVTQVEKELRILVNRRGRKDSQRRKHIPTDFPHGDFDEASQRVNEVEFGRINDQGSTSVPKMVRLIDGLNSK